MYVGGQSSLKSEDKAYALSLDPEVEVPRFGSVYHPKVVNL